MLRHVMTCARGEERPLVREMPVDCRTADPGALGDGADRCLRRAKLLVQRNCCFDNALPRVILAIGAFLQFIFSLHWFHGHYCNAILTTLQTWDKVQSSSRYNGVRE